MPSMSMFFPYALGKILAYLHQRGIFQCFHENIMVWREIC